MAAELLRLLAPVPGVRQQLWDLEGLPVLLGLLHGRHLRLLWSSAWVLVQLCQDPDARAEVRSWGGLQQLLRLLNRPVDRPRGGLDRLLGGRMDVGFGLTVAVAGCLSGAPVGCWVLLDS